MPATILRRTSRAAVPSGRSKKVVKTCTVRRSAEELFRFWRQFENLPRFSRHLVSVTQTSDRDSHWVVRSPAGTTLEWDAVIINETPNELIAWESKEGAGIQNAGTVRFEPAPTGQGTEVRVALDYVPPMGKLGAAIAKMFGEEPELQVEDDLLRFKALMEAGEIPTTEGQPVGNGQMKRRNG